MCIVLLLVLFQNKHNHHILEKYVFQVQIDEAELCSGEICVFIQLHHVLPGTSNIVNQAAQRT